MRGRRVGLSPPRRFLTDLLHFSAGIPSVPVQRHMMLADVVAARNALAERPCWPALFVKAYALLIAEMPVLRRAYIKLPWPHLREYPRSIASIAVEREYQGEPCVFFGRVADPAKLSLAELHVRIREYVEAPLESIRTFRKMLAFGRLPAILRRPLMWLGLNLPRRRPNHFGTFGLSVYSSLGAESLHPLSPLTTTLNYGIIAMDGSVPVRIIYDHRVLDGATVARALARLEESLRGPIVAELRTMASVGRRAA
jgi:hypothetical protein